MSPQAGELLLNEVIPRIHSLAPSFTPIGCEDREELCQDAIAIGAALLASTEARSKKVTAGNIAFYAVGLLRQGRRSTGVKKNDVLHPASQLRGRCRVMALEEPIAGEPGDDVAMTLHDVLSARVEDPAAEAGRRIDWAQLVESLDALAKQILRCLNEGVPLTELAPKLKRSRSGLQQHKERLAELVREHFGADILVRIQEQPRWRDSVEAYREKVACRCERQAL